MPELKNKINDVTLWDMEGSEIEGCMIQEHHSIADIARWVVENGWQQDLIELLKGPRQL